MACRDLIRATRAELLKLWHRPAFWVLALIVSSLVLVQDYLFSYLAYRTATPGSYPPTAIATRAYLPDQMVRMVIIGATQNGQLVGLILGAMLVGSEYRWRTISTALTQAPGRLTVYLGQVISLLAAATGLVLLLYAAGGIGSVAITLFAGNHLTALNYPDLWRGIADSWTIVAMWTMFGATGAILLRGIGPVIAIGYVWNTIDGTISQLYAVSPVFRAVDQALPFSITFAIRLSFPPPGQVGNRLAIGLNGGNATLGPWILLAYVVGLIVLGALVTLRRDSV